MGKMVKVLDVEYTLRIGPKDFATDLDRSGNGKREVKGEPLSS